MKLSVTSKPLFSSEGPAQNWEVFLEVKFRSIIISLSAVAMLLLSGCSDASPEAKKDPDKVVLNIPDSNLYKAEITETFNASKSSFVRKVVADGVVTEAEFAESRSRYETCLEKAGLKVTFEGIGGAVNMAPLEGVQLRSEDVDKADAECTSSSGYNEVAYIHVNTTSNPNKRDPVEMMLKCLKKRGVVEKGVTLSEFDPQYEDWDYMNAHREDFDACYADPNFYQG